MKKKNDSFLLGSLIAGIVSALCLQGMKLVDKKMAENQKKEALRGFFLLAPQYGCGYNNRYDFNILRCIL